MRLFEGTKYDQPPKCDRCGKPETECLCSPPAMRWISPASQVARLGLSIFEGLNWEDIQQEGQPASKLSHTAMRKPCGKRFVRHTTGRPAGAVISRVPDSFDA